MFAGKERSIFSDKLIGDVKICSILVLRDLRIVFDNIKDNLINSFIYVGLEVLVFLHLFPLIGFDRSILPSVLVGSILFLFPTAGFNRGLEDVEDLEVHRCVDFYKVLPISINWFVIRYIVSYFLFFIFYSVPVLLFAKLFTHTSIDLSGADPLAFTIVYFVGMLFVSFIFLIATFKLSYNGYMSHMWPRLISPLTFLGPVFYSLKHFHMVEPRFSFLLLFNPFTYILEGMRGALLKDTFLSPYTCIGVMLMFIIVMLPFVRRTIIKRLSLIHER